MLKKFSVIKFWHVFFINLTAPMLAAHNILRYVLRTQVQYPNIQKKIWQSPGCSKVKKIQPILSCPKMIDLNDYLYTYLQYVLKERDIISRGVKDVQLNTIFQRHKSGIYFKMKLCVTLQSGKNCVQLTTLTSS
jgi:hypothetical protein